jgi:hypothetical protein
MTSYCPQTRFAGMGENEWAGRDHLRFATEAEAEASLAQLRTERADLIETRIVISPKKPTMVWFFDKNIAGQRARQRVWCKTGYNFPKPTGWENELLDITRFRRRRT